MGGALLGLAQWLFLRPKAKGISTWVFASALGWTMGLAVTVSVVRAMDSLLSVIIGGAAGGAIFGLAQCLALRSGIIRRAKWTIITTAGWIAALSLGVSLPGDSGLGSVQYALVEIAGRWSIGGVIIGSVVMVALITLLPQPEEEKDPRTPIRWLP